ncbi:hypothetical protein BKA83DRAFT_4172894, partial [Pisolithus microcarpus]
MFLFLCGLLCRIHASSLAWYLAPRVLTNFSTHRNSTLLTRRPLAAATIGAVICSPTQQPIRKRTVWSCDWKVARNNGSTARLDREVFQ